MNTFGQGYVQGQQYSQLFPIYDPREVMGNRRRFRRGTVALLDRCNNFYCPAGCFPSRGWVLMARSDYTRLDPYSKTLQLDIGDTNAQGNVQPLTGLSIVQAQCVTRGLATDPNALYLVEITDARGILSNRWFQFPTTKTSVYNIRAPGYPTSDRGGTFYSESMNGATTWTWSTMLENLWNQMGTFLGTWPGLPDVPDGTPEGYWLGGVPAWGALCDVLDHLGMMVAVDHQSSTPYTIVRDGAEDSTFTTLQTSYRPSLQDDLEWIDVGAGRVPLTVRVFFKRHGGVYGTEETTPYRSDNMAMQWSIPPAYSVDVTTTDLGLTAFAGAVGTHSIWSNYKVRYDQNNAIIAHDAAYALTLARQQALHYYGRIDPAQYLSQTYAGARPFVTGSRVDGVRWYHGEGRQAWKTQIVHGPQPPWIDLWDVK